MCSNFDEGLERTSAVGQVFEGAHLLRIYICWEKINAYDFISTSVLYIQDKNTGRGTQKTKLLQYLESIHYNKIILCKKNYYNIQKQQINIRKRNKENLNN